MNDNEFPHEFNLRFRNHAFFVHMRSTLEFANEIAKEAVQNAVRHGGARNVTIVVDSTPDKLLTMDVKNDGRPISNVQKGVGSKLLDELTLRWSLENLPTGGVQLHVELPTR